MASENIISCESACTVTVVHEITVPPFNLDMEEASQIASAILLVWAVGYVFRLIVRQIRFTDGEERE